MNDGGPQFGCIGGSLPEHLLLRAAAIIYGYYHIKVYNPT